MELGEYFFLSWDAMDLVRSLSLANRSLSLEHFPINRIEPIHCGNLKKKTSTARNSTLYCWKPLLFCKKHCCCFFCCSESTESAFENQGTRPKGAFNAGKRTGLTEFPGNLKFATTLVSHLRLEDKGAAKNEHHMNDFNMISKLPKLGFFLATSLSPSCRAH